jgi:nitroimidazol reductase NimA-like FMN-containing flavoprotein (pyridoxamine 5'-phosphate oxidase superfamily)/DNA-binding XRE family transcriptional regulator
VSNVGDLGRRIGERRRSLGLSEQDLAERAGIDPQYLVTLEHSPSPHPSPSALRRLAVALSTTVDAITGGGALRPPGGARPPGPADLEPLDPDDCRALVAAGGVGRFVFPTDSGPVALPVNFCVLDGDVVFRTASGTSIARGVAEGSVSFEVDRMDDALAEGWSVLVTGRARFVADPEELERVAALGIAPWAGEDRDLYVRLEVEQVSGRAVRRRA